MKKFLLTILDYIWTGTKIILFLSALVALSVAAGTYPLIEANIMLCSFYFPFLALFGGFNYCSHHERYNNGNTRRIEHPMRTFWLVVFIALSAVCLPVGLLVRWIIFTRSQKRDGITLTKKFHIFFQKEPQYL